MNVIVLGSGVIGVSTAYYLAQRGHNVSVIDRQPAAAMETSFANAGQVSPGYAAPWAAPGLPLKALKWLLFDKHSPLVVRPQLDPAMWRWLWLAWRNCSAERYHFNKACMVRLAEYSRDCLRELRTKTGLQYDQRTLGTLQLFRTQQQLDSIDKDVSTLQEQGVPFEVLDVDGVVAREPALAAVKNKFVGALRLPDDETGDCFKFTQALAELAAQQGVQFHYGLHIQQLLFDDLGITGVKTGHGTLTADAYVVALGSYSPLLLKPLGIRLPVYPLKGYSLTMPITDAAHAPESTVLDESYKTAITRLGDRIRVGGTAEIGGFTRRLPAARCDILRYVVEDLFANGGDLTQAQYWCGLRPAMPDGRPRLGATPYLGLYIATGHGTLGWTMGAGTGRVMADIISGRAPDIDMTGLTLEQTRR